MTYKKCIYCNNDISESSFSLEHIFPDSLGGAHANEIFKTRQVCKKCNNLSGLYVDSLFVKNFFATTSSIFSNYLGYYDFNVNTYIPFSYMGFVEYIDHPKYKFCEKWLWCGGSSVYHFHNNSENDFEMIAGGDPRKRKGKNAGEVYLVGLTDNVFWINLLLLSFIKQFKKSKQILVNYKIQEKKDNLNEEQELIKNQLFNLHKSKEMKKHSLPIKLDFNIRFQAKLSLGLGYSLFGEKFSESKESIFFRDVFWNKDYKKLDELKPQMLPFFSKQKDKLEEFTKFLDYKGCHGLFFIRINNSLYFYGNLFGESKYPILTVITNELNKYSNSLLDEYPHGWGYILVPQREKSIGPFDIGSLLAFNTGDKSYLPELMNLEKLYKSIDDLPKFNITEN